MFQAVLSTFSIKPCCVRSSSFVLTEASLTALNKYEFSLLYFKPFRSGLRNVKKKQ